MRLLRLAIIFFVVLKYGLDEFLQTKAMQR